MEAVDFGRLLGQFVMDLIIGIIVTVILRSIRPLRTRWPALPYWVGGFFALLMGFIVINRSLETVITAALAGCIIILRHYMSLPKQAIK